MAVAAAVRDDDALEIGEVLARPVVSTLALARVRPVLEEPRRPPRLRDPLLRTVGTVAPEFRCGFACVVLSGTISISPFVEVSTLPSSLASSVVDVDGGGSVVDTRGRNVVTAASSSV